MRLAIPILCCCVAVGIFAGLFFPANTAVSVLGTSIACVFAGLRVSARRFNYGTMIAIGFVIGWLRVAPTGPASNPEILSVSLEEPCPRTVQGSVRRASYDVDGSALVELDLEGASACAETPGSRPVDAAHATLFVNIEHNGWTPWPERSLLRLHAKIRPAARRRNFDSRRDEGGFLTTYLQDSSQIALVSEPDAVRSYLEGARVHLVSVLSKKMTPTGARLSGALLVGDARLLSFEQRRVFRESGTSHLLSISGLHLGLIALLVFGLLRRALALAAPRGQVFEPGRLAAAATLVFCIAFTFWVGARPPVVRACVMAAFVLTGRLLGVRAAAWVSLTAACAALLIYDPTFVQNPGFQLSFAAVLGFVSFAKTTGRERTLSEIFEGPVGVDRLSPTILRPIARYFSSLFRGTLAATAVTTPIVIWHFDHACGLGVVGNLLAVPAVGFFALPLLAAVGVVASLDGSDHATWLFEILDAGFAALERCLDVVSDLPGNLYGPTFLQTAAIVLLCGATLLWLRRIPRSGVVCALFGLALLTGATEAAAKRPGTLTVDFLDVGQGDSTLVTFPDGRRWLIDAAGAYGSYDAGQSVVVPALKRLGVDTLDTVVLTHPDSDHVGGLSSVLGSIPTRRLWDNGQGRAGAGPAYDAATTTAARTGVRIERTPEICGRHTVGPVDVRVLHPCDESAPGFDPTAPFNNNSIVVSASYGRTSFLFTGDIDRDVEHRLLKKYPTLHAAVLKLAHHGSKTSSGRIFLDAISPGAAVASAGPHNAHRFPSREVTDRLRQLGIRLWRTDRDGRIEFSSDGRVIRCRAIASRSPRNMAYSYKRE